MRKYIKKKYIGLVELYDESAGDGSGGAINLSSTFLGAASGLELYRSGIDFTAVRNDATSLDLSGLAFEPSAGLFVLIEDIDSSGVFTASYTPKSNVFAWNSANQRVTVTGAAFSAGGSWNVNIWGPPRTISLPENAQLVIEQSQPRYGSDDAGIALISAAQSFTDAFVDAGSEVSMFGFRTAVFYLTLDVNSDSNLQFRVLGKHESGGTEEYTLPIETVGASVVNVEDHFWEFVDDVDQLVIVSVETGGAVPYLQCQIRRGTDGAGTDAQLDALYIVRGV